MTDQTCPLCGKELASSYSGFRHHKKLPINNECFISINDDFLIRLEKQISRIKQQAKQELMNEFDSEFEVMENEATDEENYCIATYAYDRIKKKHGVE